MCKIVQEYPSHIRAAWRAMACALRSPAPIDEALILTASTS